MTYTALIILVWVLIAVWALSILGCIVGLVWHLYHDDEGGNN
jgi:hypothetical protein